MEEQAPFSGLAVQQYKEFEPGGNVFHQDLVQMGTRVAKNLMVLHRGGDTVPYVILVNSQTGKALQVELESDGHLAVDAEETANSPAPSPPPCAADPRRPVSQPAWHRANRPPR